jgi:hypothetical protein
MTPAEEELLEAISALQGACVDLVTFLRQPDMWRREWFRQSLRFGLKRHGFDLVVADPGQDNQGKLIWYVTTNQPGMGLQSFSLQVKEGESIYSIATLGGSICGVRREAGAATRAKGGTENSL